MTSCSREGIPGFTVGKTVSLPLSCGGVVPVRWSQASLLEAQDAVLINDPAQLDVLKDLCRYPYIRALLHTDCLVYAKQRSDLVRQWLAEGVYLFGAYKIGLKLARNAREAGVDVKGVLDNDPAKQGSRIDGLLVESPDDVPLEGAVVLVASGRYSNEIYNQLSCVPGIRLINMSEFLYALDLQHITEPFAHFVEAPVHDRFRFISAFLRLGDERSRQVFDSLIGMRTNLSIHLAENVKSVYAEEYFEPDFVCLEDVRRFVDAGAATGDTLQRLEARFGPVEQAWLFEPEIPAYYEALRSYSDRPEVWIFNMGLDESPSRFPYQPWLSYDVISEIDSVIPASITSYIQGVPLGGVVVDRVGLFKLDIEGMEGRALRGARGLIARDKPVIAVCAYHRASDYWALIDEVLAIRPDYRVGIRLYADILEDVTLYFY